MKISNSTTNLVNQAYSNNVQQNQGATHAKSAKGKEISPSSNVDLSDRTKDLQKITQAMENEPVAMSEKVTKLKKEVNDNQYTIDAEKIAGKMVGSFLDQII